MFYSSGGPFICFLRLALPVNRKSPIPTGSNLGMGEVAKVETMKKGSVVVGTGDLANQPLSNPSEDTLDEQQLWVRIFHSGILPVKSILVVKVTASEFVV